MNAADVLWVLFDMILLVLFGSTLSSIISFPLTTQGQLSAVGTIVSAGYGFICGGIGVAPIYPIARKMKQVGNHVITD